MPLEINGKEDLTTTFLRAASFKTGPTIGRPNANAVEVFIELRRRTTTFRNEIRKGVL